LPPIDPRATVRQGGVGGSSTNSSLSSSTLPRELRASRATRAKARRLTAQNRETRATSRMLSALHSAMRDRCEVNNRRALANLETFERYLKEGERFLDDPTRRLQCLFSLRSRIGATPTMAIWRDKRLIADPRLLERAQLLVALEERFTVSDGVSVAAGLDEPLPAALTLIRAADEVLDFHFRLEDFEIAFRAPTPDRV